MLFRGAVNLNLDNSISGAGIIDGDQVDLTIKQPGKERELNFG
jgi:hypothetical protein